MAGAPVEPDPFVSIQEMHVDDTAIFCVWKETHTSMSLVGGTVQANGATEASASVELCLEGGKTAQAAKRKAKGLPNIESRLTQLPECAYQHFPKSFRRLKQPGDGSCFFASWANAVFGDEYDATPDKNRVAHDMRDNVARVINEQVYERTARRIRKAANKHHAAGRAPPPPDIPSYAQFKRKMHTYSTWADLVMVSVVALRMHYNLYFFDDKMCTFYYGTDRNNAARKDRQMPWVFILWTDNHSHFDLIVNERTDGTIQHKFTLQDDAALLNKIRRDYEHSAGRHAS